ncbi:NAD-dependent epimerase/dehydratase family protein [Halobellus limi]|jgi:nucleoside-diphosphate-sugar epimerase|uniref:NAD-dependent epimerase/dehydratase family protein n=1 Tax=Halobellus limi TaxID=699433 RepID=A0A1H5YTZ6_9EURY|nr:NAD-dependent epimerase/dehydratase family protein [Halobellus limi]QCC48350.1 NAD-dependent epimerase/dehydratase family protein [Halobellus limi]SEG26927.1 Nucleoside-diphosphate-sugar epimerase [Halobellus limi]
MSRVVIVGCGYVGLELGRRLREAGHDVTGVRRSDEGLDAVAAAGLDAQRADATDPGTLSALPDADWVVFAASSGGRGADAARRVYVEGLRNVIEAYGGRSSPPDRLVYTSSTGVYGDHDGDFVDEETPVDPATEKTRVLAEAERVAREEAAAVGIDGTVARFAGLYGPDRYRLDRYLEGPVTGGYLNMVHRDDAAGAVAFLLEADHARDDVVLVVDDEPVDKWAFADWLADECGVPSPPKRTIEERLSDPDLSAAARRRIETSKRCSNDRLRSLGYEFAYPTYREGYRAAIDAYRSGADAASL